MTVCKTWRLRNTDTGRQADRETDRQTMYCINSRLMWVYVTPYINDLADVSSVGPLSEQEAQTKTHRQKHTDRQTDVHTHTHTPSGIQYKPLKLWVILFAGQDSLASWRKKIKCTKHQENQQYTCTKILTPTVMVHQSGWFFKLL